MKPTKFHHQKDYDRLSNDQKPVIVMACILVVMLIIGLISLFSLLNKNQNDTNPQKTNDIGNVRHL